MKNYVTIFFCLLTILSSPATAAEAWKDCLQKGLNSFSENQYEEAFTEFYQALNSMPEFDERTSTFILFKLSECDFFLKNYSKSLEYSEKALKSDTLTDHERLICGSRRIAIFMKLNRESDAIKEYNKYVVGSSIIPKCSFSEDKIIIKNVLKCKLYQDMTREWILSKYCEKDEDIHKCDQTWIINITKQQKNLIDNEEIFSKTPQIPIEFLTNARTRTPAEIQSCCNTCSRLAAASSAICSCLMIPESVGGPVLVAACTACCLAFVETIRQDCESCCYNNLGTCAKNFETWKNDYKSKYSECPQPPRCCN